MPPRKKESPLRQMHAQKIREVFSLAELREAWRVIHFLIGCPDLRTGNAATLGEADRVLASIILGLEVEKE